MAIIVSNIRIGIDDPDMLAVEKAKRKLSVEDNRISEIYVYKRSLDARRRNHTGFVLSVVAHLYDGEEAVVPPHCRSPLSSTNRIKHFTQQSDARPWCIRLLWWARDLPDFLPHTFWRKTVTVRSCSNAAND